MRFYNYIKTTGVVYLCLAILLVIACYAGVGCTSVREKPPAPTATQASIVVTDALGQRVSLDTTPKRIVTISPTATEILYLVGGSSILRDRSSNFPAQVKEIPDVGSAYNPSLEKILAERPDLVIIEALTQARFMGQFKESGLNVLAVKAETLDDIKTSIENVGEIVGRKGLAEEEIDSIESRLASAGNDDGRTVLMLISDQDRNLYAARPESYTGLIASTLGMDNLAAGLPDSGPYPGFAIMSTESILASDPDIIVTISPAPEPAPRLSDTLLQIPPFKSLKAIRNGNVLEVDVQLFLQSPGPRIVEAVEFLKERLSPDGS